MLIRDTPMWACFLGAPFGNQREHAMSRRDIYQPVDIFLWPHHHNDPCLSLLYSATPHLLFVCLLVFVVFFGVFVAFLVRRLGFLPARCAREATEEWESLRSKARRRLEAGRGASDGASDGLRSRPLGGLGTLKRFLAFVEGHQTIGFQATK